MRVNSICSNSHLVPPWCEDVGLRVRALESTDRRVCEAEFYFVQIHTWWHIGARVGGSELELWREDALGWHSENSMTAVKLRLLKSTAAQFPEKTSLV